jgi:hypothetical protein
VPLLLGQVESDTLSPLIFLWAVTREITSLPSIREALTEHLQVGILRTFQLLIF